MFGTIEKSNRPEIARSEKGRLLMELEEYRELEEPLKSDVLQPVL